MAIALLVRAGMADEKLEKLHELITDMEIAMFTTRRDDGRLVSRPMATQKRAAGADLWFVTWRNAEKLDEIRHDPHVNLAYYKDRTREWVSVSGTARIVEDRAKIHELYAPDWRAWFGDEGGEKDGTPDDPRIILIAVDIDLAMFLEVNKPQPVVLFEVVKGMITGNPPDVGEVQTVKP
ncbi:MAG TPA: pyridoxamine 5'-phosphate oxidase family protein [Thermoanaerobaculia bacterium]